MAREGLQGYDGIVSYRTAWSSGSGRRAAARPPAYGGYEVYAGGRLIGRSRGWSSALAFGFPQVFRVPDEAIGKDGKVVLALRVRRIGWVSDQDPKSAPVSAVLTLGGHPALADRVRAGWRATC